MADVASQAAGADLLKLVCFELQGQEYGADITEVKETIPVRPITRVFLTPVWLSGIINLRGDVVAVLDLGLCLGLPAITITPETRILIARAFGRSAGLLVDRLDVVRAVAAGAMEPLRHVERSESAAAELASSLVTLEDGAPLCVLDLEKLFSSERLREYQRPAAPAS